MKCYACGDSVDCWEENLTLVTLIPDATRLFVFCPKCKYRPEPDAIIYIVKVLATNGPS
jgi:hypothetical protein